MGLAGALSIEIAKFLKRRDAVSYNSVISCCAKGAQWHLAAALGLQQEEGTSTVGMFGVLEVGSSASGRFGAEPNCLGLCHHDISWVVAPSCRF